MSQSFAACAAVVTLRPASSALAQLFERLLLIHHDLQQLERRQQTVPGHRVFQEDDVSALFAADAVIVVLHAFKYIFVADRCLFIVDDVVAQRVIQSEVCHDRCDNCISFK